MKTPYGVDIAAPALGYDSFCELWRVNSRGCVGTVVGLYGSWRFLAILLQTLDSLFSRFCGAPGPEMNANNGAKGH